MPEEECFAEANRSAIAVEGTLSQLVNRLAELGLLGFGDAMQMLEHLSSGSDFAAARVAPSVTKLKQLKALRDSADGTRSGSDRLG